MRTGPSDCGNGITSCSASDNPDYHFWNRVNFPYCDGSSFTSHRDQPLRVPTENGSTLLHMRGWDNLHAAIASLKKHYGMGKVDRLVVTGGSVRLLCTAARLFFGSQLDLFNEQSH
eukprot:COSAG04_NODE_1970_length_5110_cov_7.302734_11_plen_116_part_00